MPIRMNLDQVMASRGVSLTELSQRIGITMANLSILKTNKGRAVRFSTLEGICRELGCQPGDLLEFVHGDGKPSLTITSEQKAIPSDNRSASGLPGDYY